MCVNWGLDYDALGPEGYVHDVDGEDEDSDNEIVPDIGDNGECQFFFF